MHLTQGIKLSRGNCLATVNLVVGKLDDPLPQAKGYGIVMVAGGPNYLRMAYATISRVRDLGCKLRIQIWHLGPAEVDDESRRQFAHLKVEFVDAVKLNAETHDLLKVGGWEAKSIAIKRCPFRHVMLLDADSVPMIDPMEMFNSTEYNQFGAIFWPDIQDNRRSDEVFVSLGLKVGCFQELEAGQIMIDKIRHWKPVQLNSWFNYHSYYCYTMCHGDKDYPGLSFRKLGIPYLQGPPCKWQSYGIEHYWFDGRVAFAHEMHFKRSKTATLHPETIRYQIAFEREKLKNPLPFMPRAAI